jgi:hypothetical protein
MMMKQAKIKINKKLVSIARWVDNKREYMTSIFLTLLL